MCVGNRPENVRVLQKVVSDLGLRVTESEFRQLAAGNRVPLHHYSLAEFGALLVRAGKDLPETFTIADVQPAADDCAGIAVACWGENPRCCLHLYFIGACVKCTF